MNPHHNPHHDLRRAAAEAFQQSLDQLEQRLAMSEDGESGSPPVPASAQTDRPRLPQPPGQLNPIDAIAFAEAAADIEQFIQSQQ
ncbi:MAG: hypothetical protein VKK04_21970 [Synechococcales bacterium]|nr:hypothetical protein [Synechococcales bacterium]